jgi:thiamine biosynthesis lipoprotein
MQAPYLLSRLRVALGTFVAVEAEAETATAAERGLDAAFAAVSEVERLMHPERGGSDLAALAACQPGVAVAVHPWTWDVLALSRRLHRASRGIFDPCLSDAPGRLVDLELQHNAVLLPHAPLHVDLGGVAKGYAVDRAIEALRSAGCRGGLVNAGGDLAAFGARGRGIVCRRGTDEDVIVEIKNAALATSDTGPCSRPREHRGYYHGADRSAAVSGKVTVRAGCAAVADGLTKCLLSGDTSQRRSFLAAFGAELVP